jgi:hypothetical protein
MGRLKKEESEMKHTILALILSVTFAQAALAQTLDQARDNEARYEKARAAALNAADAKLLPLLAEDNLAIVNDCHVLKLDYEGGGEISHSSAFSCYQTLHPLYEAMHDVYLRVSKSRWESLANLFSRVRSDESYFCARIAPDERAEEDCPVR